LVKENIVVILLDIEGTTTSISFVRDELFGYARKHLRKYVDDNWGRPEMDCLVDALKTQADDDVKNEIEGAKPINLTNTSIDEIKNSLCQNILWQMDNDRKTTSLKQFQGALWEDAYKLGHIHGHIYDDVLPKIKYWHELGKRIFIYSSGSVKAQKLLFQSTIEGDVTKFITGYYDTNIGPKICSASYMKICSEIEVIPKNVVFLTDIPKEGYAAQEAGLCVGLISRPGNAELSEDDRKAFPVLQTFEMA